jgi:hypothetical protein
MVLPALVTLGVILPPGIHALTINETTLPSNEGYYFATQQFDPTDNGDFYFLYQSGLEKFWANNPNQQGLQDVGTEPLLSIATIPGSGYYNQGVLAVAGDSYISLANSTDPANYYIFFYVAAVSTSSVTIDWIYGPTAPADLAPEPGSALLLAGGLGGMAVAVRRRKMLGRGRRS